MLKEKRLFKREKCVFLTVAFLIITTIIGCKIKNRNERLLKISNQISCEVYCEAPIDEGDILIFQWEHSFEHIAWDEYYKINSNDEFVLFTIAIGGFGAGIPAEMDCTYRYDNGLIYMENIKGSIFKEFNWINSQKQLKKILLNDKTLIEGKDLPERGRIKLIVENTKKVVEND
ncbi:DUF1850 domain-containing protein [Fusobacterium sp. PH5-44]|uniref:DUF1850 domain-containing protein n=1 Tax=unclassified Fusobacterium TaxID=2648384 RepID=UPI003D1F22B1